jgi:hypothetical protein
MSSRRGEVITFADEGGYDMTTDGPWWYIRGHVSFEEAAEAVREWLVEYNCDEDLEAPPFGRCRQIWARWTCCGVQSVEDGFKHFNTYTTKSRGAFPVTELTEIDWLQRRSDNEIKSARMETRALAKWPGIEIISSWGYSEPGVRFKFPGGKYQVTWSLRDRNQVWVPLIDEEAWNAFVKTCKR